MRASLIVSLIIIVAVLMAVAYFVIHNAVQGAIGTIKPIGGPYQQQFCVNAEPSVPSIQFAINAGIKCFRGDIVLNATYIRAVVNITKAGGSYLGILDYDTVGDRPSPSGCSNGCNWTLNTWNQSVANAIADYPGVSTWEIWNEPLVQEFSGGYENGSALNYFNMVKSASTIIKGENPNATIVCFGGAEVYPISTVSAEYAFYRQVWDYGAAQYCDAISLHAYSGQYYNFNQNIGGGATLSQGYNFTLGLYENLTGKPIWITETGIASNNFAAGLNFSNQNQADFLIQEMNLFTSHQFVKRIYWFNLEGITGYGGDYGLLNATTRLPKPAWFDFLLFASNSIYK